MSKEHDLKCWPTYFKEVISGRKPFEVRNNDRGFEWGDKLLLREWLKSTGYSGRACRFKITAVYYDVPGLLPGHVAMTIERVYDSATDN